MEGIRWLVLRPFEEMSVGTDHTQGVGKSTGQAGAGRRDISLGAGSPLEIKTLNLRVTWSDPGTQAQERERDAYK